VSDSNRIERLADLERALDHPDHQARLQVLQLIAQHPQAALALRQGPRDVIDALDERLDREPQYAVRVAMLTAVAALGADPRIIERMVREAQTSHGAMEHMLSLSYLAQHDSVRARPFVRRLLFSKHRDQIRVATKLLGEERDFTPTERVRILVVEPARSTRQWNEPHLAALWKELDGEFMAGAWELIEVHHPELIEPLALRWPQLSDTTQRWLVDHADRFPPSRHVGAVLGQALEGSNPALVGPALSQIARLGAPSLGIDPERVRPFLQGSVPEQIAALHAVGTLDDALALLAEGHHEQLLAAALQHVARSGPDRLLADELLPWLDHAAWRVRAAAAFLLAHRHDLPEWLDARWATLSERARVAVARAALDQNRDQALEARLAGAWAE
jgi:hypothetical protein